MIQLSRIDHVCFRVGDVHEAAARWAVQFGLTERERRDGRAFLACDYEPYTLELLESDEPGHDHTAFRLAEDCPLDRAGEHLAGHGVEAVERDGSLHFRDVDGGGVELVPYARPDDTRPAIAQSTTTVPGFHPRKLGHVGIFTGAFQEQSRFYREVLGMRDSDWLGDLGAWLHVNADHHTLGIFNLGFAHFHHLAFDIADWGMMRVALDHVAQHGRWLAWGPVRHALGMNIASYVRIPEEHCFVELYCDMEQLQPGHQPRTWPNDRFSSNTWGQLPPRSFYRFDAAAIEAERESTEALGIPLAPAAAMAATIAGDA